MKEKWTADFSRPERSCFDIKPEISYNAYLDKGALFIGLKKKNCMAWLETADRVYTDQVIEARFRFDSPEGGYCAAGIMFRLMERDSYYLALVSSRGCFRLDAVNNGSPRPLIGWTQVPGLDENGARLGITARGDHLVFTLNGRWTAEARDASVPGGRLGFALVSYDDSDDGDKAGPDGETGEDYASRAWLDFLSVDSRAGAVEAEYKKWAESAEISAESRMSLAESLTALDHFGAAYDQVLKAWKQREEAARSVTATYTEMRSRRELLFAARIASRLGQHEAAEEYVNTCIAMGADETDGLEILAEKALILSALNKYGELAAFLPAYIEQTEAGEDRACLPSLHALLGRAFYSLNDYKKAAAAWDRAFSLDSGNGLYAANAANAYEKLGKNREALRRRLDGGKCFLERHDFDELGALVPQLLASGKKSHEAHALAGKWAFGAGDFEKAETELALAEDLRRSARPMPKADHAVCGLLGELAARREKYGEALAFFEEAARLAPDHGPYRFRLAEARYRGGGNPHDPQTAADILAALELLPEDGDLRAFAEQIKQVREKLPPEQFAKAAAEEKTEEKTKTAKKPKKAAGKKTEAGVSAPANKSKAAAGPAAPKAKPEKPPAKKAAKTAATQKPAPKPAVTAKKAPAGKKKPAAGAKT
ncbi:MAG: hypothetical protein FWH38_07730 [Treponema sp.]|nr:hypothetical protein [Treponema sp.]